MDRNETPAENLRGYLRQLTPPTRVRLLAEVERLRQSGEDIPGSDIIMAELRAAARPDPAADTQPVDKLDPAARQFFSVLDPYLTLRPPESGPMTGRSARSSLPAIWDWISRDLMASMARAYAGEVKQFLAGNRQRELDAAVLAFQNKAVKYLDGTLASATGADQARKRFGRHGGSAASFGDLLKILRVLKAREPLAELEQGLPVRTSRSSTVTGSTACSTRSTSSRPQSRMRCRSRSSASRGASRRPGRSCASPPTATEPQSAAEVAATPCAFAVVMVLDQLEDQVEVLRAALRKQHVRRAKEILMAMYGTEYAIRSCIELAGSAWGARLEAILQAVTHALDTEEINLPAGLNHVLRSPALRNHHSLTGRLTRLAWKCRDAVTGGFASLRNSQA